MLLATFPLSGTGVTESLALDHAPFTRMTPFGSFAAGSMLLEKSPPLLDAVCGLPAWAPTNDEAAKTIMNKQQSRERIFLLRILRPETSWRDTYVSRQKRAKQTTATGGNPATAAAG